MVMQMSEHEARIERESVEWVFGLTGGELSDKPLAYAVDGSDETHHFAYHYDGVPDYAGSDYADRYSDDCDYFTIVSHYGDTEEEITVDGKRYSRVNTYNSSGETGCCYKQSDEGPLVLDSQAHDGECPYCAAEVGEEHGYIYLGDGWCEVVYRHDAIQAMRDCATRHNINVWEAEVAEVSCDECGETQIDHDSAHAVHPPVCPSCDANSETTAVRDTGKRAWFWQTCSPGCMPDSDVMGPFSDETDALEDATEGLAE